MTRSRRILKSNWPTRAERCGELIERSQLHPRVVAWAEKRRKADVWSVALSGGCDSVALLLLLWKHWPERRARLVALHFNHRLRGRESTADEHFCRKLCASLDIPLQVGRWAGANRGASEAEARAARHDFFAVEMKKAGSRTLWLAHQQDDIAESLLMRLARGSGVGGLAAPRPVQSIGRQRIYVRPLLTLKKNDLARVLQQAGAAWREDSSNADGLYFRNRVRRSVLPAWQRAAGRDAVAGAARSRELLEEDDAALEAWTSQLARVAASGRGRILELASLAQVPRAVSRRLLHRWLLAVRPDTDLSRQGFELLLAAVERAKPTRFSLGRKDFAVINRGQLTLKRRA